MKKITLVLMLFTISIAIQAQTTLTQNVGNVVTGVNSVGCPGGDNEWSRLFILSESFIDSSSDFTISSGEFGVQTTDATGTFATVTIYGADEGFPGTFDNTNILGMQDVTIPDTAAEEIISFDFDTPVVVPAGTEAILYAIATPLGNNFFIGGTVDEISEGFLRSVNCGLPDFGLPSDIGFPEAHFFMTLTTDDAVLSVSESEFANNLSLSPNPTDGDLNINFTRDFGGIAIDIINVSGQRVLSSEFEGLGNTVLKTASLSNGVYFARIATDQGTTTTKFIKN